MQDLLIWTTWAAKTYHTHNITPNTLPYTELLCYHNPTKSCGEEWFCNDWSWSFVLTDVLSPSASPPVSPSHFRWGKWRWWRCRLFWPLLPWPLGLAPKAPVSEGQMAFSNPLQPVADKFQMYPETKTPGPHTHLVNSTSASCHSEHRFNKVTQAERFEGFTLKHWVPPCFTFFPFWYINWLRNGEPWIQCSPTTNVAN